MATQPNENYQPSVNFAKFDSAVKFEVDLSIKNPFDVSIDAAHFRI